jgi:acetyl-CoA synthetase
LQFSRFWEIIETQGQSVYTATTVALWQRESIEYVQKYKLESLKVMVVGEPINEEAWHWFNDHVGAKRCPVMDTWWQTETGGIMILPVLL